MVKTTVTSPQEREMQVLVVRQPLSEKKSLNTYSLLIAGPFPRG